MMQARNHTIKIFYNFSILKHIKEAIGHAYLCPSVFQRFQKAIRPLNSWRDNNQGNGAQVQSVEPERVEGPYTVNLTDMDFTAMTWEASEA